MTLLDWLTAATHLARKVEGDAKASPFDFSREPFRLVAGHRDDLLTRLEIDGHAPR